MIDFTLRSSLRTTVEHLALPVFVFGLTYAVAMVAVTVLTEPERFPVHLGQNEVVKLGDLEQEEVKLTARQAELSKLQGEIDSQVPMPVLRQVRMLSAGRAPVGPALAAIGETQRSFRLGQFEAVTLSSVTYDAAHATLILDGQSRDQHERSIQVLASFIDGLRSLPLFASVQEPEYTDRIAPDGIHISPFSITLAFAHE